MSGQICQYRPERSAACNESPPGPGAVGRNCEEDSVKAVVDRAPQQVSANEGMGARIMSAIGEVRVNERAVLSPARAGA